MVEIVWEEFENNLEEFLGIFIKIFVWEEFENNLDEFPGILIKVLNHQIRLKNV